MDNAHPTFEQHQAGIAVLSEFIERNPDSRELKRALAVKLALAGKPYTEITELLGLHKSSISTWKQRFITQGLDGLRLGYQGSKSYLTMEQTAQVTTWLKTQAYWNLDELVSYLDEHYGVVYQSKQSYYELFAAAGIAWKRSQKVNPKHDAELVKTKREEIQDFLQAHEVEIETGQLVVFF
jgi:putative transposase